MNILFVVQVDKFIPFYYQLSEYLKTLGYKPVFATFSLREHILLKKNGIEPHPANVYSIKSHRVVDGLLTPVEMAEILRFTMMKIGGSRPVWEKRVNQIAAYLDGMLQREPFEAVLIWNGDDVIGKTVSFLAAKRGIRSIYIENGYFPQTLQLDLHGVNSNSSINDLSFAEMAKAVAASPEPPGPLGTFRLADFKKLELPEYLYCLLKRKLDPSYYQVFPERQGGTWLTDYMLKRTRADIKPDQVTLPAQFAFIPFQVHDDTQILLNSRFFKNMESFFEFVYKVIRKHLGSDYPIVVKEHPEDLGRKNYDGLKRKYPDVTWLRKFNIDLLLDKASYIFVVNSSVGLQALERYKPVILFGDSFYTKDEVAFTVRDPSGIDLVMAQVKKGMDDVRRRNIDVLIRFLREQYFVSGGWNNPTAPAIMNAGRRIHELCV